MKKASVSEAASLLEQFASNPNQEPVILMAGEKPIGVLVPVGDDDLETISLSFNPKFLAMLQNSRKRQDQEGGISIDEMRRRLGLRPARKKTGERKKPASGKKAKQPRASGEADGSQV